MCVFLLLMSQAFYSNQFSNCCDIICSACSSRLAMTALPAFNKLELWLALTSTELQTIKNFHMIPRTIGGPGSTAPWITLREDKSEAAARATWHQDDVPQEFCFLKVVLSTKGVGHFIRSGDLSRVPEHKTWRFHMSLPFSIADTDGDVLLTVEES